MRLESFPRGSGWHFVGSEKTAIPLQSFGNSYSLEPPPLFPSTLFLKPVIPIQELGRGLELGGSFSPFTSGPGEFRLVI